MIRYIETFFRHKILLCAPIVLALALGVGFQLKQPSKYQSTARMWLDSPLPAASSVDQPPGESPAAQNESLLKELLATSEFNLSVASRIRTVAAPGTQLESDNQVEQNLAHQVSTATPGPQVLALSFTAPSQGLAKATGQAVVDEFTREITAVRSARGAAVVQYYRARADAAAKDLEDASSKLASYVSAHPAVPGAPTDGVANQLAQNVATAQQQFNTLQDSLNTANLDLTRVSDTSVLHIIDPPTIPRAPVGGKKKIIIVGVGAAFAGGLVSTLVMIWLTVSDSSLRREEDVEKTLGLGVVGVIEPFAKPSRKVNAHG